MSDTTSTSRREFVKVTGAAAVGASLFPGDASRLQPRARNDGTRSSAPAIAAAACGDAIWSSATPTCSSSSACATSTRSGRRSARDYIGVPGCPTFTNVDEMIDKAKPDLLMVTTVDGFHHEYIIKGLDRGLDVMTEKPLTTDETKCQAILDAEKRNNRKIVVTFNYRYAPAHQQMKEILLSGEIGKSRLGGLQLVSRRHPRRRLFPPLASPAQEQRLAAGPQGEPSLRSDELVARRRSGRGLRLRRPRHLRQERHVPRAAAGRQLPQLLAHQGVPLLLRHDQGEAADGPLCRRARARTATSATAASSARTSTSSTTCRRS